MTRADARAKKIPSRQERLIGTGIVLLLAVVAVGVFLKQFSFNPAVVATRELRASLGGPGPQAAGPSAPLGLVIMGQAENFGPQNLYHKIDGKADLYLASGFVSLKAQRYHLKDDPESWLEMLAYQMKSPRSAFAVYSQQRRPEAKPLAIAAFSYMAQNALFLASGPYYVEIVAAKATPALQKALQDLARDFTASHPAGPQPIPELAWFPSQGLVPHSVTLHISGVFGFAQMGEIFTARYQEGKAQMTAFLARKTDAQAAASLASAYVKFLLANGGKEMEKPAAPQGATLVDMLGLYEVIFSQGPILAGVHEADGKEASLGLAARLARTLAEKNP